MPARRRSPTIFGSCGRHGGWRRNPPGGSPTTGSGRIRSAPSLPSSVSWPMPRRTSGVAGAAADPAPAPRPVPALPPPSPLSRRGPPNDRQVLGEDPPPRPAPAALAVDEPGIGQHLGVVRDRGWLLPRGPSRSHEHTSPRAAARDRSRKRTGSASAPSNRANSAACASPRGASSSDAQHGSAPASNGERGADRLLLRGAGQGVDRRARRGAVGDLRSPRRCRRSRRPAAGLRTGRAGLLRNLSVADDRGQLHFLRRPVRGTLGGRPVAAPLSSCRRATPRSSRR